MNGFEVRPAGQPDVPALARFASWIFVDTFWPNYPPEDLGTFLATSYAEPVIAAEVADPQQRWDLALDRSGAIVGYCQSGPMGLPFATAEPGSHELKRLYVAPAARGSGLADHLFARCLDAAHARAAPALYLGVWSQNPRALAYYRKKGLVAVGGYQFRVGNTLDDEIILRLDLAAVRS